MKETAQLSTCTRHDRAVQDDAESPEGGPHAFVALADVAKPASRDDEGEKRANVRDPVPASQQMDELEDGAKCGPILLTQ